MKNSTPHENPQNPNGTDGFHGSLDEKCAQLEKKLRTQPERYQSQIARKALLAVLNSDDKEYRRLTDLQTRLNKSGLKVI